MNNKPDKRFVEQEAPLKNTDKAFVKVNRDGSPAIPPSLKEKGNDSERERTVKKP